MNGAGRAVGFDLDYTLCDQRAFTLSFIGGIAPWLGRRLGLAAGQVAGAFREALNQLTPRHPRVFDEALARLGVEDPRLVADLVGRYHRHRPPLEPYPGARGLLELLRDRGYRLFLVTDGWSRTQRYKVEALGLGGCFEVRVFTGDLPPGLQKPSPFPFLLACCRMGLPPGRCAYVGDNPLCDFEGPRRLGMLTIGVATGPYTALAGQAPDWRVGRLDELGELL